MWKLLLEWQSSTYWSGVCLEERKRESQLRIVSSGVSCWVPECPHLRGDTTSPGSSPAGFPLHGCTECCFFKYFMAYSLIFFKPLCKYHCLNETSLFAIFWVLYLVSPPKLCGETLIYNYDSFRRWGLWEVMRSRGWGPHEWDCCCLVGQSCLVVTPCTIAYLAPLSVGFPRQEHWSGWPFPPPGELPNPEIEPESPALQVDSLPLSHWGNPYEWDYHPYKEIYISYVCTPAPHRISALWGLICIIHWCI